jgi:hypothetical protein
MSLSPVQVKKMRSKDLLNERHCYSIETLFRGLHGT